MDNVVKTLTGLTGPEEVLLAAEGVVNAEELSIVTYEDLAIILPGATTVRKRKLALVGAYVAKGQTLSETTQIIDIQAYLNAPVVLPVEPLPLPPIPPGYPPDPSRGAPKLYIDSLKEYNGNPIDFETWELATKSTLGQTTYANLLHEPPDDANITAVARDKELFHMLVKALMNGSAMHILQVLQAAGQESGSAAWAAIITWYGSAATSRTIIDYYRVKLESLKLNQNTTASEYVNVFIICSQKLESKQEHCILGTILAAIAHLWLLFRPPTIGVVYH
jgi:hypothetical protein